MTENVKLLVLTKMLNLKMRIFWKKYKTAAASGVPPPNPH